jgi:large repetitive protein
VTVNAIHDGPSLGAQADRTVDEFSLLTVVNTASDSDVPALALTYGLLNPPAGANIDSNGVITWTPAEGQGPGTNTITTVVQDNGTPSLSATNSFVVTVNDVNVPPVLPDQTNQTIIATATLVVTNTANDPNIPATTLSYGFLAAPTNASIDANGVITWTPVVAQVPSTNTFTTVVTNFNPYALVNQRLTATNSFVVTVAAVHNGPSLSALSDRTVNEFAQLVVTNTATDSDIPPFPLNYVLLNPPVSANIDENGIITWTPSQAQAGTTNSIVTVVTDQGVPPLSATNSFLVMVNPPPSPPFIISISITNGVAWVTWTSTSGYTYQLQFKDNISDTNWSPADASMKAGGDSLTGTNVSGGSMQRLYRVMIVPGD